MAVDIRYDPFLDKDESVFITSEEHYIPQNSPYRIRLKEVPKKTGPSSITVRLNGNTIMPEVAGSPAAGQFWPDYNTDVNAREGWNTGTLQFNKIDAGKRVTVSYWGMGTLIDQRVVGYGCKLIYADTTIVVPSGVDTLWVSGVGGGGGADDNYADRELTYGNCGQWIWRKKITVTEFERIACSIGYGGETQTVSNNWGTPGGDTVFGGYLTLAGGYGPTNNSNRPDWPKDEQSPFNHIDAVSVPIVPSPHNSKVPLVLGRGCGGAKPANANTSGKVDGRPGMLIVEWGLEQIG